MTTTISADTRALLAEALGFWGRDAAAPAEDFVALLRHGREGAYGAFSVAMFDRLQDGVRLLGRTDDRLTRLTEELSAQVGDLAAAPVSGLRGRLYGQVATKAGELADAAASRAVIFAQLEVLLAIHREQREAIAAYASAPAAAAL